jgi:hypothetical protein
LAQRNDREGRQNETVLSDKLRARPTTAAMETMVAIVHHKYGIAPEDVLRLQTPAPI